MSAFLNHNGAICKADSLLIGANNRGFRYGDGLFETMKFAAGRIRLSDYHFGRLFNGMRLLEFAIPGHFTAEYFTDQVMELCKKNQLKLARIRLTVFRGNGGVYDLHDRYPGFIIQAEELQVPVYENGTGLLLGIYPDARVPVDRFSHLKSNNYLPYIMAALFTARQNFGDSILLNANGNVCESTIANVFVIKAGTVLTPSLQEGCVDGVMRRYLLESFHTISVPARESRLSIDDLKDADEIFLTNAVAGIRPVGQFENKPYVQTQTAHIYHSLVKDLM